MSTQSRKKAGQGAGNIRVGIGGWTYAPWRDGVFFPDDLAQKDELAWASRQLSTIEINGTYYGSQKPASFEKWHDETPADFVFSVKGPRFATNKRVLADAGASIDKFFESGVSRLKAKLGPILWQFMPTKQFDADDFEAFLKLLPDRVDGLSVRHAVEVRHESFEVPDFLQLARHYKVAVVMSDKADVPHIHDITAPFVYIRLQYAQERFKMGYPPAALARWADRAQGWARGEGAGSGQAKPARDVFIYMINGFKPKAPAAARALAGRLE